MSSQFNSFERTIAKKLEALPQIKLILKKTYQSISYFLYSKPYIYKSNFLLNELSDGDRETFFGYYDKSPINETNEFLIFQSSYYSTQKLPNPNIPIYIVLYDFVNKQIINRFESKTYNWQQGTKLQWISTYEFIFNCLDDNGNYQSCIVDARKNKISRFIPYPIYDVLGFIGYTINFDRLSILRPDYGYRNHARNILNINNLKNDGIFKIDLRKGQQSLILSLDRLSEYEPSNIMLSHPEAIHKVNHIMISPNGEKIMFLHRFFVNGRKYDRLMVTDNDGDNILLVSDNEMVSHCCWYGDDHIISYMRRYDNGDNYYLCDIANHTIARLLFDIVGLIGDGHPSTLFNRMIFDTYPNKSRMKMIKMVELDTKKMIDIAELYEPLSFHEETRCDLHPRWSYDGTKIFFDSVHSGKRKLYYLSLS